MMGENKLNNIVWPKVVELLNNPEKIKEQKEFPQKTYTKDEIEQIENQMNKCKNGRKRLLTLLSISEDGDIDIEEIKEKMKELQQQEKDLNVKLEELKEEVSNQKKVDHTSFIIEEAVKYYLLVKGRNLVTEEKQKILGMILQEIEVIDSDTVYIHTF